MTCPNCGKEMYKDFCMHCGYMANGNYIKMDNGQDDTDLKKILGIDYYNIEDGKLSIISLLFGPLYFCYRRYFYLGLILGILDILSFVLIGYLYNTFLSSIISIPIIIVLVIYLLLDRAFWVFINNKIYIKLLKKKIENINKNHRLERESYIDGVRTKSISKLFISLVIYISIAVFLYLYFIGFNLQ